MRRTGVIALCLLLTAACADPIPPTHERVVAYLGRPIVEVPRFSIPDTVARGQTFTAEVTSFGSSSCLWNPTMDVQVQPAQFVVALRPYIERQLIGPPCTSDLALHLHRAAITLTTPGRWAVEIFGRFGDRVVRDTVFVRSIEVQ